MMLGAFAFVALKVTGPDMQRTASASLKKQNTMDLSVIASYGFSDNDQKELATIKDSKVDYGYLMDGQLKIPMMLFVCFQIASTFQNMS